MAFSSSASRYPMAQQSSHSMGPLENAALDSFITFPESAAMNSGNRRVDLQHTLGAGLQQETSQANYPWTTNRVALQFVLCWTRCALPCRLTSGSHFCSGVCILNIGFLIKSHDHRFLFPSTSSESFSRTWTRFQRDSMARIWEGMAPSPLIPNMDCALSTRYSRLSSDNPSNTVLPEKLAQVSARPTEKYSSFSPN